MIRGDFLVKLLLLAGVVVSLGLSIVTTPAAQLPAQPAPPTGASASPQAR